MDNNNVNVSRRRFLTGASTAIGAVGVGFAATPFIKSWLPSAKAQAAGAPVTVDISRLEPGAMLTVEWRGRPAWIVHRTPQELEALSQSDAPLRDPDSLVDQQPPYAQNIYRSIKPEYLVIIGICTHLGCSPSYRPQPGSVDATWPGGFFCPCHGSKFDMSGRVYQGVPAPTNLVVPPHAYLAETVILVGEDSEVV